MEYNKLVAVTGMPGLYELVNSKSDGAIVRSLEDNSTKFASSRVHNFSHLESIEVYTVRENVNLAEIFLAMEKAGGSLPDGKDNALLTKYFEKAFPDLDFERVYASDLKKMVKWYDILKKQKIEIKLPEPPEEVPEADEEEVEEEKPAKKKAAAKKTAEEKEEAPKKKTAKAETDEDSTNVTAAKKKAAPKKTTEEKEETPKKKAAPKKK